MLTLPRFLKRVYIHSPGEIPTQIPPPPSRFLETLLATRSKQKQKDPARKVTIQQLLSLTLMLLPRPLHLPLPGPNPCQDSTPQTQTYRISWMVGILSTRLR